jgi:hypothetical protein
LYTWASFFNSGCGPVTEVIVKGKEEAMLVYNCDNNQDRKQSARWHTNTGSVQLWAASRLPRAELYELSNSKCQAILLYLGAEHATIHFQCALVQMTVQYDISSRMSADSTTYIQLKPAKVLITYVDGVQQFRVEDERLISITPFECFPGRKSEGKETIL